MTPHNLPLRARYGALFIKFSQTSTPIYWVSTISTRMTCSIYIMLITILHSVLHVHKTAQGRLGRQRLQEIVAVIGKRSTSLFLQPISRSPRVCFRIIFEQSCIMLTIIWFDIPTCNNDPGNVLMPDGTKPYFDPYWLVISEVKWHSYKGSFTRDTLPINH